MYATTMRQLEKLPFWPFITGFAETQKRPGVNWKFSYLLQDGGDKGLYHVMFDDPSSPKNRLSFDFRMKNGEPDFSSVVVKVE